jgi:hypothetical protein
VKNPDSTASVYAAEDYLEGVYEKHSNNCGYVHGTFDHPTHTHAPTHSLFRITHLFLFLQDNRIIQIAIRHKRLVTSLFMNRIINLSLSISRESTTFTLIHKFILTMDRVFLSSSHSLSFFHICFLILYIRHISSKHRMDLKAFWFTLEFVFDKGLGWEIWGNVEWKLSWKHTNAIRSVVILIYPLINTNHSTPAPNFWQVFLFLYVLFSNLQYDPFLLSGYQKLDEREANESRRTYLEFLGTVRLSHSLPPSQSLSLSH